MAELTEEQLDQIARRHAIPGHATMIDHRGAMREALALAAQAAEPVGEGFMTPDGKIVMTSPKAGYLRTTDKDHESGCRIVPLYTTPLSATGAEDAEPDLPRFGIIDPDYARIFTKARILAWSYGYACVAHGSFTRDLDLLLVPWAEHATASNAERIIRMIAADCDLREDKTPAIKPHGRLAYSLHFKKFGDPRWVDVSVMPIAARTQSNGAAGGGETP